MTGKLTDIASLLPLPAGVLRLWISTMRDLWTSSWPTTGDPPWLLHNGGNSNHFLNFKLVGGKSNRDASDAMGARIRVLAGGSLKFARSPVEAVICQKVICGANFGTGKSIPWADTVEVRWPSGKSQVSHDVEADKFCWIEKGLDRLKLQQFSKPNARAAPH